MNLRVKEKKNIYKFAIASFAVLAAAAVTLFVPALGSGGMYFLFLTAIIFSALRGDWRSGVFAAVFSVVVNFFLLHYLGKSPDSFADWLVLCAFGLAAGFTVFICHAQMAAETARRLAESRYRVIFEDAITGIYETTLDGRYAAANPKIAQIFGYQSPAELMDKAENLNDGFYVRQERREEFIRLVAADGNITGFESEIYRRDGSKIWIVENAVAVRRESGELVGFQGTTIEITDRKSVESALYRAHEELEEKVTARTADLENANKILRDEIVERIRVENALRHSEEKFRALVEVSSEMIWEVDENTDYTYVSPHCKKFNGYEPHEILGKKPFLFMPPDEARRVAKIFKRIGEDLETFYFLETVTVQKNGEIRLSETSGVPFFDNAGNFRGYRGVARDITERKKAENELLGSQKQLRDLSAHLQSVREEERKNLARELHDELGQQLTALKIELVRFGDKTAGTRKLLSASEIKNKIPAMLTIIDSAMDTTRKIVAELRPGVLDELGLAAAMEWQTQEFQKRTGIRCSLEIEFDEPAACLNLKTTVFRLLQECLTNIARHSGATKARITLRDEGYRIFFEVSDNGRGISEPEAGKPHSFGILGMRERALLLGGTVEISRIETGGTRVAVSIPRPAPNA